MLDDKSDFLYGEKSGFLYGESGFLYGESGLQFFDAKSRTPVEEPEGVDGVPGTGSESSPGNRPQDPALQGTPPGVVSLTTIEVQDAICEGPIEGLTSGKYEYGGVVGQVGYTSAIFSPHFPITVGLRTVSNAHPSGYLRSIFYNGVEVLDGNGRKNFQNVDVSWTNGAPGGVPLAVDGGSNRNLEIVRNVGERLRGPEMRYKKTGEQFGDADDLEMVPGQDVEGRDNAKLYKILNKNCASFRISVKVSQLSVTLVDPSLPAIYYKKPQKVGRGDTKATKVIYKIDYRPLFDNNAKNIPFSQRAAAGFTYTSTTEVVEEEIFGKVSAGYIRQTTVVINQNKYGKDMDDKDFLGWEVMVYRRTPDSLVSSLRNQTFIDSIVEGYEESYAYPNTAVIRQRFRADSFTQVPARSFAVRMLKVKVPNNYNPILRTYGEIRGGSSIVSGGDSDVNGTTATWNGDWKRNTGPSRSYEAQPGTIKRQWTDNPAWIFFDLLTSKRYGLGDVSPEESIDKWTLFEIAKYCDELVPDGYGGIEPRFSANIYINSQSDAHQVVNDFASVFRGISLYAGGQIRAISDKPQSPVYTFTNANVLGGDFSYSSSAKKARHTVCVVRYNDKEDSFKPSIVYSEDAEGIQKYGFRVRELSAFGCTSKGQAQRLAKWTTVSERLETQSVAFTAGVEAAYLSAGDIVQISDIGRGNYRDITARRRAGRAKRVDISGDYTTIELDSSLSGFLDNGNILAGDDMVLNLLTPPSYADVLTADFDSSAQSIYIKKSQVQKLLFRKSDVIHSGKEGLDAGNPGHLVSIVTFNHNRLPSAGNRLDTANFNVTGFTGLLRSYPEHSHALLGASAFQTRVAERAGTGFIENKPDDFIWAIEYTGKRLNITPDIELYKIIGIQEKEGMKFGINAIEHRPEKYNVVDKDLVFEVPAGEFFPGKPTAIVISRDRTPGDHVVRAKISFSPPVDKSHLEGYLVYMKFGADFVDSPLTTDYFEDPDKKLPDSEFYYTFIGKTFNSFDFKSLPYSNGTYFIRIYSVNLNSKTHSRTEFLAGDFSVEGLNLLLNLEVKSLRLRTDPSGNLSADKDASIENFESAEIDVEWQAGFFRDSLKEFATPVGFTYRVTYRKSDPFNNAPSPIILFEQTGIRPQAFVHGLSMSDNLGISLPSSLSSEITPLRTFDVVVEAVDRDGFSSAGGQIIRDNSGGVTTDSTYNSPRGYDIIYVNNPSLPAVHLTDRDNQINPEDCESDVPRVQKFCTEQWINDGGEVGIFIKIDSGNSILNNDARSVGFLMSKAKFTEADIQTKLQTIIDDPALRLNREIVFNTRKDSLVFSAGFAATTSVQTIFKRFSEETVLGAGESREDVSEIYMSVAFLDTFLFEAMAEAPAKTSLIKKLNFSNVVRVAPRGVFLRDSLLFRAWAVVHVNWESPDALTYHGANIDTIDLAGYTAPYIQQVTTRLGCGRKKRSNVTLQTLTVERRSRVFVFKEALPSSTYEIIILFTPDPAQYGEGLSSAIHTKDITTKLQVINKTINGFTVKDVSDGGFGATGPSKGTFFFGVLLGTRVLRPNLQDPFGAKFNYPPTTR